jgi:hypothetical protein
MRFERIDVQTRDGYRTAQEPKAFVWRGGRFDVEEVVDRWYEGYVGPRRVPMRYFRVRTSVQRLFVVRYHELFATWSILVTERENADEESR